MRPIVTGRETFLRRSQWADRSSRRARRGRASLGAATIGLPRASIVEVRQLCFLHQEPSRNEDRAPTRGGQQKEAVFHVEDGAVTEFTRAAAFRCAGAPAACGGARAPT